MIKKGNALDDLSDLSQKISTRERLINVIELESKKLSTEIKANEKQLKNYNNQLKKLKKEYADMVVKTHKSKSQQSRAMFLLSSQNFYQAYKRMEYMKQYTSFRKKQCVEIVKQTDYISKLNDSLFYQKEIKDTLILSEKRQKES